MPTAVFVHQGDQIDYTPGADVAAGDVVVLADLIGVAKTPIALGALGALAVTGVFDLPKATGAGSAIAAGATVYWDPTAKEVEGASSADNQLLGKAVAAAGTTDATVRVRLTQ